MTQSTSTLSKAVPKRRWSRDEYYQMGDMGWFQDQRVELIEGEVVIMSPQKWLHSATLVRTARALERAFGSGFWVRMQMPLALGPHSEPEPDVSVVRGAFEDYSDHPTAAVLVVEISQATLAFDRGEKASLYAKHGIQDYWIVNLIDRRLEVLRSPKSDAARPYGFGYVDFTVFQPSESVTPLAAPGQPVPVHTILR